MATVQEIVEAVDTYLELSTSLDITCIKGYPDFRQPAIAPPIAALYYGGSVGSGEDVHKRVGAASNAMVLTLGIYASNEIELFSLAEKLNTVRQARPQLAAATEFVRLLVGDDERTPPAEDDPKELRHFIECNLVVTYETT